MCGVEGDEIIEQFDDDAASVTDGLEQKPVAQAVIAPPRLLLSDHLTSLGTNRCPAYSVSKVSDQPHESDASPCPQSPAPTQIDDAASPVGSNDDRDDAVQSPQSLGVSSIQAASPSSADDSLASRELLEKLTVHQLRLLINGRRVRCSGAKMTKARLVQLALSCSFSRKEVNAQDTRLRTTAGKKGSPWSSDHRYAYLTAMEVPKKEVMMEKIASALTGSSGIPPPRCKRCGGDLEIVAMDESTWVGCMSYYSPERCGLRLSIPSVYHTLEERRKVVLELVRDDMLAVRMHEDVLSALPDEVTKLLCESADVAKLQHPDLRPFAPKTRLLACARADYERVVRGLQAAAIGSSLRIRRLPQVSVEAMEMLSSSLQKDQERGQEVLTAVQRLEKAGLRSVLRAHQLEFVEWATLRRRVLCADDMGLGKTLQALSLVVALDAFPALVVCPAFARSTWASQIEHWGIARPGEYHIIRGSSSSLPNVADMDAEPPKVVVVSYTMLKLQFHPLKRREWRSFILDESHRIGTSQKGEDDDEMQAAGTSECVATMRLIRSAPTAPVVFLSGTPAWTGTFDVYNQANALKPGLLGSSKWKFAQEFFALRREPIPGWRGELGRTALHFGECERPLELRTLLSRAVMIRRRREEVMDGLPSLQLAEEYVEVEKEHVQNVVAKHSILQHLADGAWAGVATTWERVGLCKAAAAKEVLKEKVTMAIETGHAVVLFVRHHRVREAVEEQLAADLPFAQFVTLYGAQREAELQRFAAGEADIAVCMVESCGVAIDLSRASVCLFLELPHTASEFQQAIARLHRQGQRSQVMVYIFLSKVTDRQQSRHRACTRRTDAAEGHQAEGPEDLHAAHEQTVGAMLTECMDRSHWLRLLRRQAEAMQLLGDGIEKSASRPVQGASTHELPTKATSEDNVQRDGPLGDGHDSFLSQAAWFLVSAETHRLHVYRAVTTEHIGLITKAPVAEDNVIELAPDDFMLAGPSQAAEFCLHRGLLHNTVVQAANEFMQAYSQLSAMDRRLLQIGGAGIGFVKHTPVPCSAAGLAAVLRELRRSPKQACKKRFATPVSTQQVEDVGTAWAVASVTSARGTFSYRQRVDTETGARFCLECQTELSSRDVPFEQVDDETDLQLHRLCTSSASGDLPSIIVRYSSTIEAFCGGGCCESYFVKRGSGSARVALVALEGGVCRKCKLDTECLGAKLRRLATPEARAKYFTEGGGGTAVEVAFFTRLSAKRRRLVVESPKAGCMWEADHELPVFDGGGEAELQNYQTLCVACHAEKTQAEARRRAQARQAIRKEKDDAAKKEKKQCQQKTPKTQGKKAKVDAKGKQRLASTFARKLCAQKADGTPTHEDEGAVTLIAHVTEESDRGTIPERGRPDDAWQAFAFEGAMLENLEANHKTGELPAQVDDKKRHGASKLKRGPKAKVVEREVGQKQTAPKAKAPLHVLKRTIDAAEKEEPQDGRRRKWAQLKCQATSPINLVDDCTL